MKQASNFQPTDQMSHSTRRQRTRITDLVDVVQIGQSVTVRLQRIVDWVRRPHGVLAVSLLVASFAADAAQPAPAFSASNRTPAFDVDLVRPGLYRLSGAGGNALLHKSSTGLVIVDSQPSGSYSRFMADIGQLSMNGDLAVRALILTSTELQQVTGAQQFVDAGVPVIAQKRASEVLVRRGATSDVSAEKLFVVYDNDYLLQTGGVEVEIEHVGSGRTGADSVVLFRDLRVIAVGELFTHGTPQPDCASGGSFAGWAAAIDHVLWFEFDAVVPGRGPLVDRAELMAFKARLQALDKPDGQAATGRSACGSAN